MSSNQNLSANELREKASESRRRVQESWERSDTDGFLSQWAGDLSARLYTTQAQLVEANKQSDFAGLYDVTGETPRRVAAKLIDGQFGQSWLLRDDEAAKYGRRFIPFAGVRLLDELDAQGFNQWEPKVSRIQKKLGLVEMREMAPAWAKIDGKGHGLSGTAWVAVYRSGDKWGQDATLIVEEGGQ